MKFQESAAKLERIATGFNDATTSLAPIFSELKRTSSITAPEASVGTAKYAASAALISEIETVMQQAANPELITVAIQLAKIQEKIRIALPGGAVMSQEELEWVRANPEQGVPGDLFYILAQQQLIGGNGTDGVRNPSATGGRGLLANWLKERVVALDPYKEGPRASQST